MARCPAPCGTALAWFLWPIPLCRRNRRRSQQTPNHRTHPVRRWRLNHRAETSAGRNAIPAAGANRRDARSSGTPGRPESVSLGGEFPDRERPVPAPERSSKRRWRKWKRETRNEERSRLPSARFPRCAFRSDSVVRIAQLPFRAPHSASSRRDSSRISRSRSQQSRRTRRSM